MKTVENSKGFKVLNLSKEDTLKLGFGFVEDGQHICVCMSCNEDCGNSANFIAALGDVMCDECLKEWLEDPLTKRYEEDIEYEEDNYNIILKQL